MFPPGRIDQRKLQRMMREMGLEQEEIRGVEKVVVHLKDGTKLVFKNPSMSRLRFMGQEMYQLVGKPKRVKETSEKKPFTEEDVKLVAEQAGVSEEKARKALEETDGDLAAAIMKLKQG